MQPSFAELSDLARVDLRQIVPELLDVGINRGIDRRAPAAIVHHAGRRDGQFGRGVGYRLEERRSRRRKCTLSSLSLPLHLQCGGSEFDHALLVAELSFHVVLHLGRATHLVQEIHVPGGAAELAVGDTFQSQIFLLADDFADGLIFNTAQIGRSDASALFVFAGLEQLWRTEQAAHVIGAEGWSFGLNHRIQLTQKWEQRGRDAPLRSRFCYTLRVRNWYRSMRTANSARWQRVTRHTAINCSGVVPSNSVGHSRDRRKRPPSCTDLLFGSNQQATAAHVDSAADSYRHRSSRERTVADV